MADKRASVLLVQFAKAPIEGQVKTRMIPFLTPRQACDLHCELVLWTSGQLVNAQLGDIELAVSGSATHPLFEQARQLGVAQVSVQRGTDLGQRMYHAIRAGLCSYNKVILVGSDCPAIDAVALCAGVEALDHADVVLGPAEDGGYVLIGARKVSAVLFEGIPWGTAEVYAATREALLQLGWEWAALPPMADVDRPQDIAAWHTLRDSSRG